MFIALRWEREVITVRRFVDLLHYRAVTNDQYVNPLKHSGVRWSQLEVFSAIQV